MALSSHTFGLGKFQAELNPPDTYGTTQVFGLGFQGNRQNDFRGFVQIVFDKGQNEKGVELIISDMGSTYMRK